MSKSKRVENILKLNAEERYLFTVKSICDSEAVWYLDKGGMVSHKDQFNTLSIPFWPDIEFAQISAINEWQDSKVMSMDLNYFLFEAIPYIININANVLVFPISKIERTSIVDPKSFVRDIVEVLTERYGEDVELDYLT